MIFKINKIARLARTLNILVCKDTYYSYPDVRSGYTDLADVFCEVKKNIESESDSMARKFVAISGNENFWLDGIVEEPQKINAVKALIRKLRKLIQIKMSINEYLYPIDRSSGQRRTMYYSRWSKSEEFFKFWTLAFSINDMSKFSYMSYEKYRKLVKQEIPAMQLYSAKYNDIIWNSDWRIKAKPSCIGQMFSNVDSALLGDMFASVVKRMSEFNYTISVMSEMDYNIFSDVYQTSWSSTSRRSCMRGNPMDCWDFYFQAMRAGKLKFIYIKESGSYIMKAFCWLSDDGDWILDRVYHSMPIDFFKYVEQRLPYKIEDGLVLTRTIRNNSYSACISGDKAVITMPLDDIYLPYLDNLCLDTQNSDYKTAVFHIPNCERGKKDMVVSIQEHCEDEMKTFGDWRDGNEREDLVECYHDGNEYNESEMVPIRDYRGNDQYVYEGHEVHEYSSYYGYNVYIGDNHECAVWVEADGNYIYEDDIDDADYCWVDSRSEYYSKSECWYHEDEGWQHDDDGCLCADGKTRLESECEDVSELIKLAEKFIGRPLGWSAEAGYDGMYLDEYDCLQILTLDGELRLFNGSDELVTEESVNGKDKVYTVSERKYIDWDKAIAIYHSKGDGGRWASANHTGFRTDYFTNMPMPMFGSELKYAPFKCKIWGTYDESYTCRMSMNEHYYCIADNRNYNGLPLLIPNSERLKFRNTDYHRSECDYNFENVIRPIELMMDATEAFELAEQLGGEPIERANNMVVVPTTGAVDLNWRFKFGQYNHEDNNRCWMVGDITNYTYHKLIKMNEVAI